MYTTEQENCDENVIRHVKSHTNSSVTDISQSSLEEYHKKKKSLILMPRVPISKNVPLLS